MLLLQNREYAFFKTCKKKNNLGFQYFGQSKYYKFIFQNQILNQENTIFFSAMPWKIIS